MSDFNAASASPRGILLAVLPLFLALQALWQPLGVQAGQVLHWSQFPALLPFGAAAALAALFGLWSSRTPASVVAFSALALVSAVAPLGLLAGLAASPTTGQSGTPASGCTSSRWPGWPAAAFSGSRSST